MHLLTRHFGRPVMCKTPSVLKDGTLVACRKCNLCRENRVRDWVGRCMAESETAVASSSITLTYGRDENGDEDHWHAAVLHYSDVQKFLKRLRRDGYPVRFLSAGEYGGKKGRAHWHLLLFWQKEMPAFRAGEVLFGKTMNGGEPYPEDGRFMERHWPHGWSFWRDFADHEIRYVCKYILKQKDDREWQGHLAMSKVPPLGAKYFAQVAGQYVDQGLSPQVPEYSFRGLRKNGGKGDVIRFRLERQSLDLFLQSFVDQWAARRGGHPPSSQLLEDWLDKKASAVVDMEWRPAPFVSQSARVTAAPFFPPAEGSNVEFSESHNAFFAIVNGERLWWSFDEKGERAWRRNLIIPEAAAPRLGAEFSRKNDPSFYRKARDPG